jgi:hypothetical protein
MIATLITILISQLPLQSWITRIIIAIVILIALVWLVNRLVPGMIT